MTQLTVAFRIFANETKKCGHKNGRKYNEP